MDQQMSDDLADLRGLIDLAKSLTEANDPIHTVIVYIPHCTEPGNIRHLIDASNGTPGELVFEGDRRAILFSQPMQLVSTEHRLEPHRLRTMLVAIDRGRNGPRESRTKSYLDLAESCVTAVGPAERVGRPGELPCLPIPDVPVHRWTYWLHSLAWDGIGKSLSAPRYTAIIDDAFPSDPVLWQSVEPYLLDGVPIPDSPRLEIGWCSRLKMDVFEATRLALELCVDRLTRDGEHQRPSDGTPDALLDRRPVHKPAGWTQTEIINQVKEICGTFSRGTFYKIREAAGIPERASGGAGAQQRYSRRDVRRLIEAVDQTSVRKKPCIRRALSDLIGAQ